MAAKPVVIHRVPQYERLQRMARRYPALGMDPSAVEAFMVLVGVARQVSAAAGADLWRHGLLEGRFLILALLLESHPKSLSHSQLAELSGVTKGNITGLVDGLERDGNVKREESGEDRRVTPIALTAAGRRLIEKVLPDHLGRIAGLMGELSLAERKMFVSLLTKVQGAVSILLQP
jgi:DNA-binding MarR family transcriptional regulator